ncbi:MAG: ergothioneine biosynthesis protein EgtB [Bacteroidetes bacterium]|nr:ergothioneine biosynthesis protein EgtB [Bacteroidota bacterium]
MKRQLILRERYNSVRSETLNLMAGLSPEDHLAQSSAEASPPKWHLGHTTWFFETLILKPSKQNYQVYNPQYAFYFNSYYEALGPRIDRAARASLSRPSLSEIHAYRDYVDKEVLDFIDDGPWPEDLLSTLELGLNHEQQHQELFLTDFKKALGQQAFFPVYRSDFVEDHRLIQSAQWIEIKAGLYDIGCGGNEFHFDNEGPRHKVYLNDYAISSELVSNADWQEFMEDGGYEKPEYWHMEGWEWLKKEAVCAPLYWLKEQGEWMQFSLSGLKSIRPDAALCHISFYEASAYAQWKGLRLPTEAEWEVAQNHFHWGERWEWTNSAYLPYPGFKEYDGPAKEYNAKFMINQMVLRGASIASPTNHSRPSYRNFFHPHFRWQFNGLRLAKNL